VQIDPNSIPTSLQPHRLVVQYEAWRRAPQTFVTRTASLVRSGLCAVVLLSSLPNLNSAAQTTAAASATGTQTAADQIALGDKAATARDAKEALAHYEAAVQLSPKNYEALWKASGSAIDLGEAEPDAKKREAFYAKATTLARQSYAVDSAGAESNFAMARGLGRTALTLGSRDRVKYAKDVRMHALKALAADPKHPGAMHVMGVWNAEIMRLNSIVRMFAKTVLGGAIFSEASWASAAKYMEGSVAADPARAVHHLDLARVYRDMDRKADARAQYDLAIKAPLKDANDGLYQKEAAAELKALK
jgi:tetratricopeptide (TPR) repeat protein